MAGRRDSFTVLWLGQKCSGLDRYLHYFFLFFFFFWGGFLTIIIIYSAPEPYSDC